MFCTYGYRQGFIHVSVLDHKERIEVQFWEKGEPRFRLRQVRSVHAAKCFLSRHAKGNAAASGAA